MKNISYKFWLPQQLFFGVLPFVLNAGIPLLLHQPIDWITTLTVTVSVFLASGFRRSPFDEGNC
jgi:hypothetical protein